MKSSAVTGESDQPLVFIAEDNPILLQGLQRALAVSGYRVRTAADGAAMMRLLESAANAPPDLLLLDVMMPELTGLEVLEHLRADRVWARLPVVLLTAASQDSISATAAADERVRLLIKPFRLKDLLDTVAAYMPEPAVSQRNHSTRAV